MSNETVEVEVVQDGPEATAREQGWVPKEEWSGDPHKWVPAEEFIRRGELFEKIDSLKSQLFHLKKDFNVLAEHHKKVAETEYAKALQELKQQRAQAAKEGDTEAVVEISEKIEDLKENTPKPQINPPTQPEFEDWVSSNKWYQEDADLNTMANALGMSYSQKNPNAPLKDILDHVTKQIKKIHPEKFGMSKVNAPAVESATPLGRPTKKGFTEADLDPTEKEIMETLVNRGVFGTDKAKARQKYMEELAKVKGR